MANKSVIDIDVNDQQFKQFYELYKGFSSNLEEMPESWKALNEASGKAQDSMIAAFAAIDSRLAHISGGVQDMNKHLRDSKALQKQFGDLTGSSESAMKRLAHASKGVRDTLFGIGGFLTKMGVLGLGVFTGATFGLDKLAQSAVGTQRTARGLGMTPGQLKAFQTDFGLRYMDEGTLGNVVNARSDLVGSMWMRRALGGVSSDKLNGMDPGELGAQLAIKAHDWWVSHPDNQRNPTFYQPSGLQQSGISFDLARQYGNTDRAELLLALTQYRKDSQGLNIGNKQLNGLYAFERQLKLAGADLETYLSRKLSALGPHLGSFITTLEKDGKKLLDEVLTPKNLDALGHGLDEIASYLGSKDFLDTMKSAGHAVMVLSEDLVNAAAFIAKLFPDAGIGTKNNPATKDDFSLNYFLGSHTLGKWAAEKAAAINGGITPLAARQKGSALDHLYASYARMNGYDPDTGKPVLAYDPKAAAKLEASLAAQFNLPAGLQDAVIKKESNYNPLAYSSAGAMGIAQFTPATAARYGVNDPYNWQQALVGQAKDLDYLSKKYHHDLAKTLAAYNAGEGSVAKAVQAARKNGGNFLAYMPKPGETTPYVYDISETLKQQMQAAKAAYAPKPPKTATTDVQPTAQAISNAQAMLLRPRGANVNIRIFNQSGSNVAVSTNAAAAV